jgi:peptidoglycan LD-endopeptidase LytH
MHWYLLLFLGVALAQPLAFIPTAPYNPQDCRPAPAPRSASEASKWEEWPGYRERIALLAPRLAGTPDKTLLMPVKGLRVQQIGDTFAARRPGRRKHEGQDIFAKRGTPVYSATEGFIVRMGYGPLGGLQIFVLGAGERRYYYAHLDRFAALKEGDYVTVNTLLGYVGNTGIARNTPTHLHFGMYEGSRLACDYRALNPLSLLKNRNWDLY